MANLIPFTPSKSETFTFQPILDGTVYACSVTWNLFGQRWYVNCYDTSGGWIFTVPLIGSTNEYDISITAGYFASTMIYRVSSNTIEISP